MASIITEDELPADFQPMNVEPDPAPLLYCLHVRCGLPIIEAEHAAHANECERCFTNRIKDESYAD